MLEFWIHGSEIILWTLKGKCCFKGPFNYYVIKEVGGWGGQMMMFDNKVGAGGVAKCWCNQKIYKEKNFFSLLKKNRVGIFFIVNGVFISR